MFTTNENKINMILAGVTGSLLCEIDCGDISNIKEFRKELKDCDSFIVHDQVFGTFYNKHLKLCKNLDQVKSNLIDINHVTNYKCIQNELKKLDISTCGYTSQGRLLTIYNNVAQLTIDCSKPTGPQMEDWISKWF